MISLSANAFTVTKAGVARQVGAGRKVVSFGRGRMLEKSFGAELLALVVFFGGMRWGSATDGQQIYVVNQRT